MAVEYWTALMDDSKMGRKGGDLVTNNMDVWLR